MNLFCVQFGTAAERWFNYTTGLSRVGSFVLEQLIATRFIGYNGSEIYFLKVEQAFSPNFSAFYLWGLPLYDFHLFRNIGTKDLIYSIWNEGINDEYFLLFS